MCLLYEWKGTLKHMSLVGSTASPETRGTPDGPFPIESVKCHDSNDEICMIYVIIILSSCVFVADLFLLSTDKAVSPTPWFLAMCGGDQSQLASEHYTTPKSLKPVDKEKATLEWYTSVGGLITVFLGLGLPVNCLDTLDISGKSNLNFSERI